MNESKEALMIVGLVCLSLFAGAVSIAAGLRFAGFILGIK